jgi:hypothetical protein
MLRRLVLASLSIPGVVASGCFLLTGSTSGYSLAAAEGGCESAAECENEGGGAQVCCLSATLGASVCQESPCGTSAVQLCAKSAECPDAACLPQSCAFAGTEYPVRACGAIPLCARED